LLAIMAHPDDAEVWAGGAILNHRERGDEVLLAVLTYREGDPRGHEAQRGAELLGAEVRLFGAPDRHLRATPELVEAVAATLATFRPTLVLTHWPDDSHPDHSAASEVARRAIVATPRLSRSLHGLFACDTYYSLGLHGPFVPDLFVDISTVWERKLAAIRAHTSQSPEEYVALIERQCRQHGARAGTRYAEAFRRLPLYGRLGRASRWLDS